MPDETPAPGQIERWIRSSATIIAPVTALSALLFYFGYVSARSQFEYFGVDVDTIGLGTQDYIMRSPQPLLAPLLVLTLVGAGAFALHTATRRRIATAAASVLRVARGLSIAGLALLGAGVILLVIYAQVRDWALYNLVTPLLIALGAALTAYGSRVRHLAGDALHDTEPAQAQRSLLARRTSSTLIYVLVAVGIFWMTATVAEWTGRGLAQYQAQNLGRLPSVILDTKERLYLRSPGIEETVLPESQGQTFHYRYRRLRLLIHGGDRMFLVPDTWSASNSTLIVALDGSVRVQFQFQNRRP
ncbi:MAG TPA: hypothetical protein VGX25_06100 [Actinophytocola sp.]|uniref:hypothetical protein n=1 Tax=Actinophytocola sp. TaxID=1872138 RepID=UPI002DDD82F3|nr:hypothetical protein [Actinophytocola sp.]HEV2778958.1 hypothetical protein [Actinophytocola sp.]